MEGLLLLFDGFRLAIGDAAFYAIFGFAFVFLGIVLLIGIFMLLGLIMKQVNARKTKKQEAKAVPAELVPAVEEGVSPEVVAAITAALMAYYEEEKVKCDFVVRRIKRI